MEWISVKDRLPKNDNYVLVCYHFENEPSKSYIGLSNYYVFSNKPRWRHENKGTVVTRWAKLPKLPKLEEINMEWISVKHSLPEDGADKLLLIQAVMVFNKYSDKKIIDEFIVIGKFEYIEWYIKTMSDYTSFDDFGYIEEAGNGIVYIITHWMDLPEPPKGE